jgi:hypothetical protein
MADSKLRAIAVAFVLVAGGCEGHRDDAAKGSVTVKLPPARPAAATPAFSFKAMKKLPGE